MKRKSKATISFITVVIFIIGIAFPASAAKNIWKYMGDADLDGTVTILDATAVQRCLADLRVFSRLQTVVADVNGNNEIDIHDATVIQKELLQLDSGLRDENNNYFHIILQPFYYEVCDMEMNIFYEGDSANVGEPVTFFATAKTAESLLPISYEYRIHEIRDNTSSLRVIRPRSDNPNCIYVFDQPGEYLVDVYAYNAADVWSMTSERIYVSEL